MGPHNWWVRIIGISICHYGGRPRFLAAPPLTLNLPLMASKETLEQVKNLLKQELSPINSKLDGLTTKLSDIDTAGTNFPLCQVCKLVSHLTISVIFFSHSPLIIAVICAI